MCLFLYPSYSLTLAWTVWAPFPEFNTVSTNYGFPYVPNPTFSFGSIILALLFCPQKTKKHEKLKPTKNHYFYYTVKKRPTRFLHSRLSPSDHPALNLL